LLSGCVYRVAVQQGNFLDDRQIEQLQAGMTRAQVRFLLGTPMLPDAFDQDRWDYVYYLKIGRLKQPEQRRLSVFFEDDKVARFEKVGFPPAPAPAANQAATQAATQAASR
jgi:outer membrane protein assembly factor BamE